MFVAHVSFLRFDGSERRFAVGELSFVTIPRVGESVGVRLNQHIHYGTVDAVEHQPKAPGAMGESVVMVLLSWRAKYEALPGD